MRGNNKELIEHNFSRYASRYDTYSDVQDRAAIELISMAPRREVRNILDLGCGTGTYTLHLARTFKGAAITAVDISRAMIDAAMDKCSGNDIDFVVADAEGFVSDRQFDLITSNATFQWVEDFGAVLTRCRKMLSGEGTILFSAFGPGTFTELSASLRAVAAPAAAISAETFLTKYEVTAIMKAHFEDGAVEERTITREYSSVFELLRHIKYTGTRGRGLEKFAGNRGLFNKIERAYRDRFGSITATYQIFFCKGAR